jgi:hypothetical protein
MMLYSYSMYEGQVQMIDYSRDNQKSLKYYSSYIRRTQTWLTCLTGLIFRSERHLQFHFPLETPSQGLGCRREFKITYRPKILNPKASQSPSDWHVIVF